MALKRVAASSLSDICKHSLELAQTVVDAGAIAHLAQMILNPDAKLKVSTYDCSSTILRDAVKIKLLKLKKLKLLLVIFYVV